jgi:uncharacterized protein YndB with AHSA1/START domain
MAANTIRLHRVLRATPERLYRAFLDADALAKWVPPNGFTGKVHHLDAKVGGTYNLVSDVAYKETGSAYERERCKLDLYLPKIKEHIPIVIGF